MTSVYNNSADIAEHQLKKISATMCYAKWAQTSMNLTNGMTHSCYHPPLHNINPEEIKKDPSALHNTTQKKLERKLMLEGKRPPGCNYCWKIEDNGYRSDRIYRSGEFWAQNSRSDIFDALDTENIIPRYVEVNFNQTCNLKCMYCSPHLSSAWEQHVLDKGDYEIYDDNENLYYHNNLKGLQEDGSLVQKKKQADNLYIETFWKWLPTLYKKLEIFRMTGGEPLMDSNMYKILDYVYENPNTSLEISVTTNFDPPSKSLMRKFIQKLKKLEQIQIWEDKEKYNPGSGNHWYVNPALKNFALFVSLDSVGDQAEYIRDGLKFDNLDSNVQYYLQETNNTTLTFINTFNILSVPKFKDFLKFILKYRQNFSKEKQGVKYIKIFDPYYKHPDYEIHPRQRIWFDVPLLRNPSWMCANVLPKQFCDYLQDSLVFMKNHSDVSSFVGFYDFEIAKVERNLKIMSTKPTNHDVQHKNFAKFFQQYDQKRNKSFNVAFPELISFLEMCKSKI